MSLLERIFGPTALPPADPIDHPALRGMTPQDLADMPFPRDREAPPPARPRRESAR